MYIFVNFPLHFQASSQEDTIQNLKTKIASVQGNLKECMDQVRVFNIFDDFSWDFHFYSLTILRKLKEIPRTAKVWLCLYWVSQLPQKEFYFLEFFCQIIKRLKGILFKLQDGHSHE